MPQNVTTFPPNSNVIGYIRDSGGARQELSVVQQKEVILRWAEDAGVNVIRFFVDEARSGAGVAHRSSFLEMIGWLEQGQSVAAVVVWSLSRFSRDYNDAQLYLARIRSKGYQIFSLEENIPPGSVGRIVESLHLMMAEAYRVELSSNVRRGSMYVVKAYHAWPRAIVPVGYRKKPVNAGAHRDGSPRVLHSLEPDPATAPLVIRAFQMRRAGATIREIREETGLYKNLDSYSRLWRNKIYIGVAEYGGETIERFCEPLVDLDTWAAVQELNERYTEKRVGWYHPRRANSDAILSGLVFCKACGSPMRSASFHRFTQKREEYWRYYQCQGFHHGARCRARMIPAERLEQSVLDAIRENLLNPDLITAAYEKYRATFGARSAERRTKLDALQEEIKKTERRIANLSMAIADSGHTRTLLNQLTEQEDHRDALAEKARELSTPDEPEVVGFRELTPEELTQLGARTWAAIEQGDARTKQRLARAVVERVDVIRKDTRKTARHLDIDGQIIINPAFGVLK